jgi:hypothetical protein
MRKNILLIALLFQLHLVYAHVGNSNTTLEGMAGPYHVLVNIKSPDVIPGLATLTIFTSNQPGVKVYARPIYFYSGEDGAPGFDLLHPISNSPGQFTGDVWLMNDGSASIEITIKGPQGEGKMIVPVVAVSITTQKMPPATQYMLIGLGILLFILMITIVGASVSDGITKAGETVPAGSRRAKRIGFVVATLLCTVLVYGGNRWWTSVAKKTSEYVFKPMHAKYQLSEENGVSTLHFTIDSAGSQRSKWLPYIIPDHGKIMHFFVVSLPKMDVFAHLHPVREGPINFAVNLPPLPKGKYLAFADIVYNSGFTETIKDTIDITHASNNNSSDFSLDSDDAFDFSQPLPAVNTSLSINNNTTFGKHTGEISTSKDGTIIMFDNSKKKEKHYFNNELNSLEFSLWDANHKPLIPDLYMGMKGHLMIVRIDGLVFSHVHPVGTYSMAAQTSLMDRINLSESMYKDPDGAKFRDSVDQVIKMLQAMPEAQREDYLMKEMEMPAMDSANMNMNNHNMQGMNMGGMSMHAKMNADNTVRFPYTFPTPGRYRIWVEMKKDGKVYTGVFDRDVK